MYRRCTAGLLTAALFLLIMLVQGIIMRYIYPYVF